MGDINSSQLHYVEVMCESILVGVYCVLVLALVWVLTSPRPMPAIHKVMLWAGVVMWLLSAVHLGLVIQQVTTVVTPPRNAQAQVAIAGTQFMIGDMILIWRVWTIWSRNYWFAILPFMLMLAAAGVRFSAVATIVNFADRPISLDVGSGIIVANTMLCTLLILGRIWYLQWQMNKLLGHDLAHKPMKTYKGILMLIIESGALYALSQLLALILDHIHSPGNHTVLDMQIPLIGILPTLIVLFVHFDLVPGTHASEGYNAAVASTKFQAAPGPGSTASIPIARRGPRPTAVTLMTETIDDRVGVHHGYKQSLSDDSLRFKDAADMA